MNIFSDFDYISGVRHACMINHGEVKGSTFPEIMSDSLLAAARIMNQMLAGIQSLGEDHNELHLSMEDGQLLGFRLHENAFLLLMTDQDINQALINTSVRSSKQSLLKMGTEESNSRAPDPIEIDLSRATKIEPVKPLKQKTPLSEEMKRLLKRIAKLLAEQVGPAATVLFKRVYATWLKESPPSVERTRILASQLALYIENEEKRAIFQARANSLIDREMSS